MAPGMCPWASSPLDQPVGCPRGKQTGAFHTKPDLAWTLIKAAREAGIPFRLVVAERVEGAHARLEGRVCAARIPSSRGLRPAHGTWQWVEDPKHPPAFPPAEAARALAQTGRASHGALGQSWQGTHPLRSRTGVGARLWPDLWDPPGGRDPGPQQAGS